MKTALLAAVFTILLIGAASIIPAPAGLLSAGTTDTQTGDSAQAWTNESWLNADGPVTLESLRGRAILLNFWTFTCYNCTNTVPALVDLDARYRERGLTIIGIHTPEFPAWAGEHSRDNVQQALDQYGIEYPNAQDNDRRTWRQYGIRYWPSFVLIDRQGVIRHRGIGEFHVGDTSYDRWTRQIENVLAE